MHSSRTKFILLGVAAFFLIAAFFIYFSAKVQHIMGETSIYWGNEWQVIHKGNLIERKTIFSGSELDFDFTNVKEFQIKGSTTNTDDDTSVVVFIDKKDFLLPVAQITKGALILAPSDTKMHSFRLIFYCRGYNPCNFTLTDIIAKGGTIVGLSKKPFGIIGIVGDSISLLYAKDNYSSILSRDISYHLHNASVWGRSLAHTGKISPAVGAIDTSLIPYKPSIVIVMLGTNDILENVIEEDFTNDYKSLLNQMHSDLPHTKIVVVSIFPGRDYQLEQVSSQWNADLQSYLSPGVSYIDMTQLLHPKDYLDAIHPNIQGQKKIADFLHNYLVAHHLL